MWHDQDLREAASSYEKALQLAPEDLGIIGNAAILLKGLGHLDDAILLIEFQARPRPGESNGALQSRAHVYRCRVAGREAIESLNTTLRLSPDYFAARSFIGVALMMQGDPGAAADAMQREPSEAYRWLGLAMAYHANGDTEASDAELDRMIEKYESQWAYNIAYVFAYRNDADRAFEWLDKAVDYGDPGLADIVAEILFTSLHTDPRWWAFLERIGRSPEQLRDIRFSVPGPG